MSRSGAITVVVTIWIVVGLIWSFTMDALELPRWSALLVMALLVIGLPKMYVWLRRPETARNYALFSSVSSLVEKQRKANLDAYSDKERKGITADSDEGAR